MSLATVEKLGRSTSVIACLLLVGALSAQSPPPFAWVDTAVPDTIGAPLGFGDVDGDGAPDLIEITYGGIPQVLRNDGHGRFTPTTALVGAAGIAVSAIADFNVDGFADVALVGIGPSGFVSVWFGSAAAVLSFGYTQPVQNAARVAAGDVNGDGAPDLVFGCVLVLTPPCGQICNFVQASVVLLNDGFGILTPVGTLGVPFLGTAGVAFSDVDQDGDQDLITSSGGTVFNNGGTFGNAVNVSASPNLSQAFGVRVARFDDDIYPDALVTAASIPVGLYLGGPAGLTLHGTGPLGTIADPVDLNSDGIDEIVMSDTTATTVYSVGPGGAVTPTISIPRVGGPMLVRDVDADGDRDVLIHENVTRVNTLYFSDGAGGLLEHGPAYQPRHLISGPVPMDVNADGVPDLVGKIFDASTAKLAIATNDGVGRFSWSVVQPAGQALTTGQTLMLPADLDADGDKDLVLIEMTNVSSNWTFTARAVSNDGGGAWTEHGFAIFSSGAICDAAVADMNGDGTDDVVFGDTINGVRIIYGYSGLPIVPGTVISALPATRLALADMDGDGDLDVVVAHNAPSSSHLLVNQGGGVFAPASGFPTDLASFCSVGDVTGDGLPDCYLNNHLFLQSGGGWTYFGDVPTGLLFGGQQAEVRSFDFDGDGDFDTLTGVGLAYVNEGGTATTHGLSINPGSGQHITPVDLDRDDDLDLVFSRPVLSPSNFSGSNATGGAVFNTARQLTIEAPARPGHLTHMGIRGAPGGTWFLFASTGLASIAAPPFGTILIDPAPALQIGTGTLDSQGKADWSLLLPASFSIYVGVEFDDQAFVDTVAGPRITNARRVVISAY